MDRWASGVPPLGFQVVDHSSGKGKGLATDPEGKKLLQQMAEKLLDGWSFIRIAAWCNETGVLTNMERARVAAGKPAKARPWTVNVVVDALTSPRTQGLKMTGRGKHAMTVLDSEGEPIRLAPPTFDADTWKRIQEAAQLRKIGQRTPSKTSNPVLGVGFCGCTGCSSCGVTEGICGSSLALQISRNKTKSGVNEHRYYRCGRTPLNCNGVVARAEEVDFQLAHEFGWLRGDEPMTRRVFVPGEDHSAELEQVNATIDRLRMESDAGLLTTPDDERQWLERMKAQVAKRDQLAAMPSRAAGWVTEEIGQTKSEAWRAADEGERRQRYLDAGLRYVLGRKGERSYFDRSQTLLARTGWTTSTGRLTYAWGSVAISSALPGVDGGACAVRVRDDEACILQPSTRLGGHGYQRIYEDGHRCGVILVGGTGVLVDPLEPLPFPDFLLICPRGPRRLPAPRMRWAVWVRTVRKVIQCLLQIRWPSEVNPRVAR